MAKTGPEAPGTAGSQFYVVTGADAGLPPEYALLGKVSKGLDVVSAIGELGDPASASSPLAARRDREGDGQRALTGRPGGALGLHPGLAAASRTG